MKKGIRISIVAIISIFVLVVVCASALLVWQYENISAFVVAMMYDEAHLDDMVKEAHKEIIENMDKPPREPTPEENEAYTSGEITLEEYNMILTGQTTLEEIREAKKSDGGQQNPDEEGMNEGETPREPTAEEQKAYTSGEITLEEYNMILTGKTTLEQIREAKKTNTQQPKPDDKKPNEQKPADNKPSEQKPDDKKPTDQKPEEKPKKDAETLISEKVAEMYAIKAEYYAEFNNYWAAAKAEFLARPEQEHTQENVAAVVKDKMDEGLAMEDRYDARIEQVLSELTELLKSSGKNTDLVETIRNAYNAEKKAEKARIMKKYFG